MRTNTEMVLNSPVLSLGSINLRFTWLVAVGHKHPSSASHSTVCDNNAYLEMEALSCASPMHIHISHRETHNKSILC